MLARSVDTCNASAFPRQPKIPRCLPERTRQRPWFLSATSPHTVPHEQRRHAEVRLESTSSFRKTSVRFHLGLVDSALREIRPIPALRSPSDVLEEDLGFHHTTFQQEANRKTCPCEKETHVPHLGGGNCVKEARNMCHGHVFRNLWQDS